MVRTHFHLVVPAARRQFTLQLIAAWPCLSTRCSGSTFGSHPLCGSPQALFVNLGHAHHWAVCSGWHHGPIYPAPHPDYASQVAPGAKQRTPHRQRAARHHSAHCAGRPAAAMAAVKCAYGRAFSCLPDARLAPFCHCAILTLFCDDNLFACCSWIACMPSLWA